jgi:hypothetical protein
MLAMGLTSKPLGAAFLIVVTYVLEVLLISFPPVNVGLLIYPQDIVFTLLFVAALLRYVFGMTKAHGTKRIVLLLVVLFSISLLRGFATYGLKQAGVGARTSFYFLSGVAYFSSFGFTPGMRKKLTTLWLAACAILVGIAVFRWIATLVGLSIVSQWQNPANPDIRVLNASQAMFLAIGFFASLSLDLGHLGPPWQRKLFYVLGPVLLLLQHRTVWVVLVVGLLWLGLQDARFRKKVIGAIAAMAIVGILLAALVFGNKSDILVASLEESASNDTTFLWRVVGWRQLLFNNPARNHLNDTIGQPFGTGYERVVGNDEVDFSPHNYYVEAFLRFGIIGLFLLVRLYVKSIRGLKRVPANLRRFAYPDSRFWALVLLLQLTYFLAYGVNYEQSILTGMAITGLQLKFVRPTSPEPICAPV